MIKTPEPLALEPCEHCAKPNSIKTANMQFLISNAISQVFNLNRGLSFILIAMINRPDEVINAFITWNRFRYLLISATLALIVQAITCFQSW